MLLENGALRVKITDFGLAQSAEAIGTSVSGLIAGTPSYMSPEQAAGEAVDHRSDMFSLGSVLYTLCVGRSPSGPGRRGLCSRRFARICAAHPRLEAGAARLAG